MQLYVNSPRRCARRGLTAIVAATVLCGMIPMTALSFDPEFGTPQDNPFGLQDGGVFTTHSFVDIDGDGDQDLFTGAQDGYLLFQRNSGNSASPTFESLVPASGLFDLPAFIGGRLAEDFGDIDGDGDFDLFAGEIDGKIYFFENTGNAAAASFAAGVLSPFGLVELPYSAVPKLVDIDGDGDLDLFAGEFYGTTYFFANTGNSTAPAFDAGQVNPFGLGSVVFEAAPSFADFDGDGDFDAMIGDYYGNISFHRNTGDASNPAFEAAVSNPFGFVAYSSRSTPEPVDLDGDFDIDLISGNQEGTVRYFPNTTLSFETTPPSSIATISATGTASSSVSVDFTASDAGTGVDTTALWVKRPGDAFFSDTGLDLPGTSGTFSYTITGPQGVYEFYTIAVDNVGNVEAPPATADDSILYDSIIPTIPAGIVRLDTATSNLDAVEFQVTFSENIGSTFTQADVQLTGTITAASFYVSDSSTAPVYKICVNPDNPNQNGTIGIRINGVVEDAVGNDLVVPVNSLTYTITNFPAGDVNKSGLVDIADVALLADFNLGIATLP